MLISDLSYLEAASNTSEIAGGGRRGRGIVVADNEVAIIKQTSLSAAFAKSFKGDATAVAVSVNYIGEVN